MEEYTAEQIIGEMEDFTSSTGLDSIIPQPVINIGIGFLMIVQEIANGTCPCDSCVRIRETMNNLYD